MVVAGPHVSSEGSVETIDDNEMGMLVLGNFCTILPLNLQKFVEHRAG